MNFKDKIANMFGYERKLIPGNLASVGDGTSTQKTITNFPAGVHNFTTIINPGYRGEAYTQRPYGPEDAILDYRDIVYDVINFIARPFSTIGFKLYDKKGAELSTDSKEASKVYDLFNRPFKNLPEAKQKITGVDLFYIMALDLLIFGNFYGKIFKEDNPRYILPLSPQRMTGRILNKNGFIEKYLYQQNIIGEPNKEYDPSEIVHLQYMDPMAGQRFVWGLSPLAAHRDLLSTLQKMKDTQDDAFDKGGLPSIIAKVDGAKTGDNTLEGLARIREMITNRLFKQKDKVAVVDAELMDLEFIKHNLAELEFIQSYIQIGHSVAAIYGVDPMFIGFNQTTNLAQARAAIFVYGKYTLKPFLDMIQSQLNLDFIEPAFTDNVVLKFNWLMEEDRESLRADLRLGADKAILTPNEERAMLFGMKPIKGIPEMDKPLIQMATVSIGDQFKGRSGGSGSSGGNGNGGAGTDGNNTPGDNSDAGGRPRSNPEVQVVDDTPKELEILDDSGAGNGGGEVEIVTKEDIIIMIDEMLDGKPIGECGREEKFVSDEKNNSLVDDEEIEKAFKKEKNKWQQLAELALRAKQPACTRKLQDYFDRQLHDVTRRLDAFQSKMAIVKRNPNEKDLSTILFGMGIENEILIGLMYPEMVDILNYSIQAHINELGAQLEFESVSQKVIRILENGNRAEGIFGFVKDVNETTDKQLRETLIEGIKKGESVGQLAQRIAKVKADATGYRAEGIARAVVIAGFNQAGFLTAREDVRVNGGEARKFWYTSNPAMRENHNLNEAEAKKVGGLPLEQPYQANGLMYPGDPSGALGEICNCKCAGGIVIKRPNRQ